MAASANFACKILAFKPTGGTGESVGPEISGAALDTEDLDASGAEDNLGGT
jgi:hypothetical protein